jgi:hypothetical protein
MHLKIDNLSFDGDLVGIDFEYDEDFRRSVARACNVSYISQKDLQRYIVHTVRNVVNVKELLELRDEVD